MRAVLQGRDSLVVLPTGGGKSLCYQIPALYFEGAPVARLPWGELWRLPFTDGMIRKPLSTFGTVNADVLALKDPNYRRLNFCSIILGSAWDDSRHNPTACSNPFHNHGVA